MMSRVRLRGGVICVYVMSCVGSSDDVTRVVT